MNGIPAPIAEFLKARGIAVTGVSRDRKQPANAIYRRLVSCGYRVAPVNPRATVVEGVACHANLAAVPGPLEGVVIASPPDSAVEIVRACGARGVRHIWFHRSFGSGSVSEDAVRECRSRGIEPIVGGCPLMFCGEVDMAHRCFRWWLQRRGRMPR
jgi:predicted CoA-binding protein